jgi:hypothetical protein
VLASAGEGDSVKAGADVKYQLTPGLTGLLTLHPDFATVEQNVTNINFSYTQHFISDQRPFFAEGSAFFPASDIYYSPAIGNIDGGLGVTGKESSTSIGFLSTDESGKDFQRTTVGEVRQDINPLSDLYLDYADNNQSGLPSNQVYKLKSAYAWQAGRDTWYTQVQHTGSWLGGDPDGGDDFYALQHSGARGKPSLYGSWTDIGPNFVSDLGFIPYTNIRGYYADVDQNNTFDKGYWQSYDVNVSNMNDSYHTGGFFMNGDQASFSLNNRPGNGIYASWSQGQHQAYRDHVNEVSFNWNDNSTFAGGNIDGQFGTQEDQHSRFLSLNQGYGLSRQFILSLSANHLDLGPQHTTQVVFSPAFRLTAERSIGGRAVMQGHDTDIFLSYEQKARTGSDIFFLIGDPNSPVTRGLVQLKVATPF